MHPIRHVFRIAIRIKLLVFYNVNTLMFYLFPFMRDGSINSALSVVKSCWINNVYQVQDSYRGFDKHKHVTIPADGDRQPTVSNPTRPVPQATRQNAHKRRRHSTGHSRDEGDNEATPRTTRTEPDTNDRQVNNGDTQTGSAKTIIRRSNRPRCLRRRVLEASRVQSQSDSDFEVDPIISHFRKRKTQTLD